MVINGRFYSQKVETKYDGKHVCLGEILLPSQDIEQEFLIKADDLLRKRMDLPKGEQKKSSVKELRVLPTNMQKVLLLFQTLSKNRAGQSLQERAVQEQVGSNML